ncbi:hypothetical protein BKN38_09815 [Helicobacter sp. CLO-3]|uniref:hypothetical protein n=1 Tax=Helicobacter sp. CLO-3 TaxID=211 RepID=UPI0008DA598D|nr:hypothetical protein [Helicobacter sp. CLO-3]OHU81074.1 hypothetical protein BKN38_09815 [Helicobacter sp. CLO-3]
MDSAIKYKQKSALIDCFVSLRLPRNDKKQSKQNPNPINTKISIYRCEDSANPKQSTRKKLQNFLQNKSKNRRIAPNLDSGGFAKFARIQNKNFIFAPFMFLYFYIFAFMLLAWRGVAAVGRDLVWFGLVLLGLGVVWRDAA